MCFLFYRDQFSRTKNFRQLRIIYATGVVLTTKGCMSISWTPHPILEIPSEEEQIMMGAESLLEFWQRREAAIERERSDPFRYGTELDHWKLADEQLEDHSELLVCGGNRSAKSTWAAKRVVQTLVANPGTNIWCFTTSSQNSIALQQAAVYNFLPPEFKKLGHSRVHSVRYSIKNGFTNSAFVLPNRSTCTFRNFQQDVSTVEGGECGLIQDAANGSLPIGVWLDEEYSISWLTTLRYRCLTRADSRGIPARIISTFTTISGWTPVVSQYLTGARTLIDREAELLDNEKVPVLQQSIRANARIVYFHTKDNPYNSWKATKSQLKGATRDEIKCRAYGLVVKPANTVFPNLDDKVVMKHEDIPIIKEPDKNPAQWVLSIDPGGSKPFFILLVGITANGVHYVVDEWPDSTFGTWADLEKGTQGRPGEAALPNGYGIADYAEVIRQMIGSRENVEIIIDPRMGAATYQKSEGTSNIIADLHDEGIHAYPAEGLPIDDGLQAINSLLSYDKTKPIGFDNHSKLIFSDKCQNTIHCCSNYQVEHGPKAVTKDPVDCLRYIAIGRYKYYEDHEFASTASGGY
jgi:hypothetical protein